MLLGIFNADPLNVSILCVSSWSPLRWLPARGFLHPTAAAALINLDCMQGGGPLGCGGVTISLLQSTGGWPTKVCVMCAISSQTYDVYMTRQ